MSAARRQSHLTPVSSIAITGGGIGGAGEQEAWLDDPTVLTALSPRSLALAHNSSLLLIPLHADSVGPIRITFHGDAEAGRVSAVEWVPLGSGDGEAGEEEVVVVGTDAGYLLVYSVSGDLVHKQSIYPGKILKIRFRERKDNLLQDSGSDELSIVLPGVIARFDGLDLQAMLQKSIQEAHSRVWKTKFEDEEAEDESSFGRIPFQLWSVNKFGSCADAAIVGLMPPPLLELQSSQRHYCAVTIGEDAVVSAYRLSEDRSRSIVGAILSRVVPATFSTITSFSKMIWRSDQSPNKKTRPKPQSFAKTSPLTCLKDPPRKGEKLTLSPSGTLAVITDSLGRVLLLDTQALVAVRLWKGYRDASCLFVEMLVNKDKATSSNSARSEYTKSDYCLCLAIHAPRKGIIEVWQMRTGPRLLTIQCPKGSRILQPSTRPSQAFSSAHIPLEAFLFNGDSGQLSVLNRHIG